MAKKRNTTARDGNILFGTGGDETINQQRVNTQPADSAKSQNDKSFLSGLGRGERIAVIGVCLLLVVGALGATGFGERIGSAFTSRNSALKTNQSATAAKNSSMASSLSAVMFDPTPLPLSKEYIYAGSRMLAVEDANASAVPPADLAVWRPSSGYWYVLGGPGSQQTFAQWGQGSTNPPDVPVPGDYDGDGKTDFAVFRPTNNNWYITLSSTNSFSGFVLGNSGDTAVPADYDGDGKTDIAVYQNGAWAIRYSSTGNGVTGSFGQTGDIPVPADFDGDGKADLAVFRVTSGLGYFYYLRSSLPSVTTPLYQQLGQNDDKPVVGDFDGDGQSDIAVYRESSSSTWYVSFSANNYATYTSFGFGQTGDKVVHNDYDGDGKVDIAVWRPSSGNWYIRQSSLIGQSNEVRQQQWGATGDTPVPAFYRR